jgi:transcription-repair coupling factor (superfamily II helicase)
MKLVARNAKRGAQFTPQGVLRYPLSQTKPDEVLMEIRLLLDELTVEQAAAK